MFSKAEKTRECEAESIPEYSSLKISLYLTQTLILISLVDFNVQVENFQGQALIIEDPLGGGRERENESKKK